MRDLEGARGSEFLSTSAPSGNQVDGLPLDCHTETIAKLDRVEPAKNDTRPPEFSRVDNVSVDEIQENPKKTLSIIYRR